MKFFEPEDFYTKGEDDTRRTPLEACEIANAKLEQKGRIVIGSPETNWDEGGNKIETHKALLINIEPIEKCKHPRSKVWLTDEVIRSDLYPNAKRTVWKCDCSAKVKVPDNMEFEEIE